jgi:chromosome partitioning protein
MLSRDNARKEQADMPDAAGRIILVCKLKGGAGATTTCRELAVAAVAAGLQVALVDLDSQGGLTRWWSRRTKDEGADGMNPQLLELAADRIAAAAPQLRQRFDLTVIDSPPTVHETIRAVASSADLALIPARPTVDDLDAVGPIARLLRGVVDMGFVLTQVPGGRRSRDGAEALERLAGLASVLGRTSLRLDYPRPAGAGGTGFEGGGTAQVEIADLLRAILERLDVKPREELMTLSRDTVRTE